MLALQQVPLHNYDFHAIKTLLFTVSTVCTLGSTQQKNNLWKWRMKEIQYTNLMIVKHQCDDFSFKFAKL